MAGKKGVHNKKYDGVDRYAIRHFFWMQDRATTKGEAPGCQFPRTREGYLAFCQEIGPVPTGMARPTVGRLDHSRAYGPGNIRWEEFNHNSRKRFANQDRFAKLERLAAEQRAEQEIADIPF